MSIREELVLKALAGEESKVDLAAKFGVSRKTVYKWLDRYKERGLAGLVDESRRGHRRRRRHPGSRGGSVSRHPCDFVAGGVTVAGIRRKDRGYRPFRFGA